MNVCMVLLHVQLDNVRCNLSFIIDWRRLEFQVKNYFCLFFLQIQGDAIDLYLKLWMMR